MGSKDESDFAKQRIFKTELKTLIERQMVPLKDLLPKKRKKLYQTHTHTHTQTENDVIEADWKVL